MPMHFPEKGIDEPLVPPSTVTLGDKSLPYCTRFETHVNTFELTVSHLCSNDGGKTHQQYRLPGA